MEIECTRCHNMFYCNEEVNMCEDCFDKLRKETFCSCGRNMENHNEFIDKSSIRYQQARHDVCTNCIENAITQHRKDK